MRNRHMTHHQRIKLYIKWSHIHSILHAIRWIIFENSEDQARVNIRQILHVKMLWNKNHVIHLLIDKDTVWSISDQAEIRYMMFSVKANHNDTNTPKIIRSERMIHKERNNHHETSIFPHSSILAKIRYEIKIEGITHRLNDHWSDLIWEVNDGKMKGIHKIKSAIPHQRIKEVPWVKTDLCQKISLVIQSRIQRVIYEMTTQRKSEMVFWVK